MSSSTASLDDGVDTLARRAVSEMSVAQLQQLIADCSAALTRLAGVRSRALAELHVRGGGQVPDPAVAGAACPLPAWLRAVAKVTGGTAGREIRTGVALRELPAVAEAIVDGDLTVQHGRVLARLVGAVEPSVLLESQAALIEVARRTDPDQLAQYVRHLLATWCEPALEADEAAAEERRFLQLRNTHRGSWRGTFELPDAAMEAVLTVLEPLARREGDADQRSAGQRRADALADVFAAAARYADLPEAGGSRPLVTYVVPTAEHGISTRPAPLVDLDRHPGAVCSTAAWTGPASRTRIQQLLCDARTQVVVLGLDGQVVSLAPVTDMITAAQRRAVAARDRCCTAKGCSRPPAFCDVHHLQARADGGSTTIDNLVLLCRRHHVMWHREQLTLRDLRVPWKRLRPPRAPDTG